ncbi:MAG: chalcone isomerase family protein [Alphaproteobacteria bacterium]|nr:chalcone isomerase family protein [Alphaproteobacteria bacterium]
MRSLVIALFMLLVAVPAFAAAPSEIGGYIKADKPYGEATLRKFMFHVYDAALWTDAASWTMKKTFALTLRYGMNFDGDDLAKRSISEMDGQEKLEDATAADWRAKLAALFPDVKKGDRITAVYLPANGTRIYHNGKYRGSITNLLFSERFIGIWMSPQTSEPAVRKALIGGK